jgi:hypothetical protein
MTMKMLRGAATLVGLSVFLTGCGGGSATTPTPVATPTPTPASAVLSVNYINGTAKVGWSKDPRYTYGLQFQVQIAETGGLAVHADYVRLQLLRNGVESERDEITAADIIAGVGTNLIQANTNPTWTLILRFNDDRWSTFNLFFHFTDVKGNIFTPVIASFPDIVEVTNALSRHTAQDLPVL